jgi:hypothetical protein
LAVDRTAALATAPQSRHLIFKPCRRLLGRRSFGSRLKQLNRQAIGALALALEICPVIGCRCFEPRDLRRQCVNLCRLVRQCCSPDRVVDGAYAEFQRDQRSQALCHHPKESAAT